MKGPLQTNIHIFRSSSSLLQELNDLHCYMINYRDQLNTFVVKYVE